MNPDENKVHGLALEIENPRMTKEDQEVMGELPRLQYVKDFKRRALFGGPLTFLEAKFVVREQLTWDHWRVTFYEMVNFPHAQHFKTKAQAMEYFTIGTQPEKRTQQILFNPQRMEVWKPKGELFGSREAEIKWKVRGYTPDAMEYRYR